MIYENELKSWEIVQILTQKDDYVKFAFECNEVTIDNSNAEIQVFSL